MNPPPSYHEVLSLLNKTRLNEMKLIDENECLIKELETCKMNLKIKTDELELRPKSSTKESEKIISKI
jgi:hypothetical protein